MFTGIIEAKARIMQVLKVGTNTDFCIESDLSPEFKIDQSVAHNGVCLTVVAIQGKQYKVTAVNETLLKTNLNNWTIGDTVNLERSLRLGDRLDGHLVQGHVDTTAVCVEKQTLEGSWLFRFRFDEKFAALVIEKGSICLNGVSLTIFNVLQNEVTVTIIPYTYEHTNFAQIEEHTVVNVEFDVMGKYLLRQQSLGILN
ncbi:MAG: riboflavin synthase [Phycisphaerales bacterium]|nr:riboflavin synthase [Phycisphaerales bacterium]